MNENKKQAKQYKQSKVKNFINKAKNSAYSGLYSEIAYIISIILILIDNMGLKCKKNTGSKVFLFAITVFFMVFFSYKVKKNEESINNRFLIFLKEWATDLGYLNMPITACAILADFLPRKCVGFIVGGIIIMTISTAIVNWKKL